MAIIIRVVKESRSSKTSVEEVQVSKGMAEDTPKKSLDRLDGCDFIRHVCWLCKGPLGAMPKTAAW